MEVALAASVAGRGAGSCADAHSQMVVENRAKSDSSHVFPDYSQLVPDRTVALQTTAANDGS